MNDSAARAAMTMARWQDLKAILSRALECDSDSARVDCVAASCGDDPLLRAEVEQLLAQDDRTWCDEAFLAGLKAALFGATAPTPALAPTAEPVPPRDE